MSDISIPGVNSKFQTQETIAKLVKAESAKLDPLKKDLDTLNLQKTTWQDLNRAMTSLRTTARNLFSFENPFNDRAATSSNEAALTATASRDAVEGNTKIEILQTASPDRFVSKGLAKDAQVPAGNYEFSVGAETVTLRYRGGNVKDFAENLSRRAEGVLKATVVQTQPDTQVLVIEGLKSGAQYQLSLKQDAAKMGLDLGLIAPVQKTNIKLTDTDGKVLSLRSGEDRRLDFPAGFTPEPGMVLELKVKLVRDPEGAKPLTSSPTGPQLPQGPEAALRNVRTHDITSEFPLPPQEAPPPVKEVQDAKVLFALSGGTEKDLPPVADSSEFATVQIPLDGDLAATQALVLHNRNTFKVLSVTDAHLYNPNARNDFRPANPASTAQDAKLKIDGLVISRPTNIINDVIPGVTMTVVGPSDKPVNLKVEPDRKQVKAKLIEFVAQYNAVVREVNIDGGRKDNTDLVNELDFLTKEQKDAYFKKLGVFQGNTTLNFVKSKLSTTASNAYETRAGQALRVLGQIGISTNANTGLNSVQATSLRGYLEINEKTLDKALSDNFLAVKDLFGRDSNGDLLIDNGIAYQLDTYLQSYVQSAGLINNQTSSLDRQIKDKQGDIDKFQDHLKQYEADLKLKYGRMEGAINQLDANSRDLRKLDSSKN